MATLKIILEILGYFSCGLGSWLLVVVLLYPKLDIKVTDWLDRSEKLDIFYTLPIWLFLWWLGLINAVLVLLGYVGNILYKSIRKE